MHSVLCQPTEWSHPMKKSFLIPAACGLALCAHTQAESFDTAIGTIETSMNVTLATDYIWRGSRSCWFLSCRWLYRRTRPESERTERGRRQRGSETSMN